MILNKLIENMKYEKIIGSTDFEISGIGYDSRKVIENYIFVCISGFKVDGHSFAEKAIELGAVAIVTERLDSHMLELNNKYGTTLICVKDCRKSLAELSNSYYGEPSKKLKLIGVTGTNGKTSITQIMINMLEGLEYKCGVLGTIENRIIDTVYPSEVTTPESLELNQLFYKMNQLNVEYCTMEVSSHALELDRVANLNFEYGIFTNLSQDHLGFHKTMEAYFEAKARLFRRTTKYNIINIDDSYGKRIVSKKEEFLAKTITYGIDNEADISATRIEYSPSSTEFLLSTPKWEVEVSIPIPGKIYVYNYLAAVSVLYLEGMDAETIYKATQFIKSIPGRLETVNSKTGINVIVDFAHTPDSLENVLKVVRTFTTGKLITVFGCGGDRDTSKRPIMGRIATELSDYTFVTSDNPRTENPDLIIKDILEGISVDKKSYTYNVDRKETIIEAVKMAKPEDTILIAGKGHETYQIIGTVKYDFDDREIAFNALEEK